MQVLAGTTGNNEDRRLLEDNNPQVSIQVSSHSLVHNETRQ